MENSHQRHSSDVDWFRHHDSRRILPAVSKSNSSRRSTDHARRPVQRKAMAAIPEPTWRLFIFASSFSLFTFFAFTLLYKDGGLGW